MTQDHEINKDYNLPEKFLEFIDQYMGNGRRVPETADVEKWVDLAYKESRHK